MHACIDGYSRLIIYLHCANNNMASTVLDLFKGGVRRPGLPSRTRSDRGLENVEVARLTGEESGLGRGSMLTGKSLHNVRVECLHRDVYPVVLWVGNEHYVFEHRFRFLAVRIRFRRLTFSLLSATYSKMFSSVSCSNLLLQSSRMACTQDHVTSNEHIAY